MTDNMTDAESLREAIAQYEQQVWITISSMFYEQK